MLAVNTPSENEIPPGKYDACHVREYSSGVKSLVVPSENIPFTDAVRKTLPDSPALRVRDSPPVIDTSSERNTGAFACTEIAISLSAEASSSGTSPEIFT